MAIISVIVPIYNVEQYLKRCVDSVLEQTFSDFELILVDDGSNDGSSELCDVFAAGDSRVYVIHQKNSGVACARNAGLERALSNGCQWISFVDSDDWVHPRFLELLYHSVQENDLKLSCCGFRYVEEGDIVQDDTVLESQEAVIKSPEELFFCEKEGLIMAYLWRWLFHCSLFRDIRFPEGRLWEDVYTTPKVIFQAEKAAGVNAELYFYYRRSESITKACWKESNLDRVYSTEYCLRFCERKASAHLCAAIAREHVRDIDYQYCQVMMSSHDEKKKKQILMDLRSRLTMEMKRYKKDISLPFMVSFRVFCIMHPPLFQIYFAIETAMAILNDRILMLQNR